MGWFEDLKNRIWLESRKALRNRSVLNPPAVLVGGAKPPAGSPVRMAGKVLGHPAAQGGLDVGLRLAQGEDPRDAVIDVGAGMAASAAASKVLPKHWAVNIPGSTAAYMAGSGTANWLNQNLVKPMFAGGEQTAPARIPAATYGPTGAPIGGVGGGNAGASAQPPLGPAPATRRPAEEQRPPVSREVPASPTSQPQSMNELAQMYARQRVLGAEMAKGGELQRRLYEGGAVEGMSPEALMTWVDANPDLAYRLAEKRGLLPGPV
jgi:hypothetical protein